MGTAARRRIRAAALCVAVIALGGIVALFPNRSVNHKYDVRVVVREATNGQPLAGVRVDVLHGNIRPSEERATSKDGTVSLRGSTSSWLFRLLLDPEGYVQLSKEGYETQHLSIRAPQATEQAGDRTVVVETRMQPEKP